MSGRDEPLFLLDRGKNNRGPADLLSVWVQFLAVWSTSTFARLIVRSQPEHRIAPNKTDLFLASAMTIALVTDRHHELVQRDWKRRFKDLQAVLSYVNLPQEDKPKRGRGRDLRAWRQIAMDLRGSCRMDGEEGRIDRKLLLRRIRDHLKSNPVPIASGDELTKQALDSFLDNAAHWVVN